MYEDRFENLLHQLPTDPHGVSDLNIATQVQKVTMSNINKNKIYSNINIDGEAVTGARLIAEWRDAIVSLSNSGRRRFEKMLGLRFNRANGTYTIDHKKLFKELASKAEGSNMPEDVINIFNSFDEQRPNKIPLQALMDNAWIENAFISMLLNETIDIKSPGGMYVQRSPFGIVSTYDNGVEIKNK